MMRPKDKITMHPSFDPAPQTTPIPITFVTRATVKRMLESLPAAARQFAEVSAFAGKAGQCLVVPDTYGTIAQVLFGLEDEDSKSRDLFRPGQLGSLPPGTYRFANKPYDERLAALAFALGQYRFRRYRKADPVETKLALSNGVDGQDISRIAEAATLARDLVNTPANDMGPQELSDAARLIAERYGAKFSCVVGDDLVTQNFQLIHADGHASPRAPR